MFKKVKKAVKKVGRIHEKAAAKLMDPLDVRKNPAAVQTAGMAISATNPVLGGAVLLYGAKEAGKIARQNARTSPSIVNPERVRQMAKRYRDLRAYGNYKRANEIFGDK